MSTTSPSTRRRFIVSAVTLALVSFAVPSAGSADDRPTAITYANAQPGAIPQLSTEALARPTKRVLITNEALHPSRVTLEPGERIEWQSYASAATSIVFEREVAGSMICHSLVNFSIQEDELRSAEIHTGEKASFCELKPGQYRYRAVRKNPITGSNVGTARRIEGWIVVNGDDGQGA